MSCYIAHRIVEVLVDIVVIGASLAELYLFAMEVVQQCENCLLSFPMALVQVLCILDAQVRVELAEAETGQPGGEVDVGLVAAGQLAEVEVREAKGTAQVHCFVALLAHPGFGVGLVMNRQGGENLLLVNHYWVS